MKFASACMWFGAVVFCVLLSGCAPRYVDIQQLESAYFERMPRPVPPPARAKPAPAPTKAVPRSTALIQRAVTEGELNKLSEKDPDLTPAASMEILARLNGKDRDYVKEDIKAKRRMKVPVDFVAYKKWSPLPADLSRAVKINKFILIAKNIPFIGWYTRGRLSGDAQICIGKEWEWTPEGIFKVLEKDPNHISQSYNNAYGEPAWMPMALRIYGLIWIHAGDVIGGYCSHGCINVPIDPAEKLYDWAQVGTPVLVLDSLKNLQVELTKLTATLSAPKPAPKTQPTKPQVTQKTTKNPAPIPKGQRKRP